MTLDDAIEEWNSYRKGQGFPPNTVAAGRAAMKQFLACTGNIQMSSLGPHHGEMFVSTMLGKGYKPTTHNQRLSLARSFMQWARDRRYLKANQNPMSTTRFLKVEPMPRRRVPVHDFDRLLDAGESTGGPQARIIVALGLYLFLRASEVRGVRVGDVDLEAGTVRVWVPKGKRWDTMPVSLELDRELRRWLTWYTQDAGELDPEWFLVPARHRPVFGEVRETRTLNPTSPVGHTSVKVHDALRAIGWDVRGQDKEGIHTLRRSGARAWFDDLVTRDDPAARDDALRKVAAMLHHKSVTITEPYLGLDIDRERRDVIVRGERMFSAPDRSNVTEIRREA